MRDPLHAQHPRSVIWRRRVVVLAVFAAILGAIVAVTATTLKGGRTASGRALLDSLGGRRVLVGPARRLDQPVAQAAGAQAGAGAMLVIGGLASAGRVPVNLVQRVDGAGATVVGHLPAGLAGAAAVELAGAVYVFGGGGGGGGGGGRGGGRGGGGGPGAVGQAGGGGAPLNQAILGVPVLRGGAVRSAAQLPAGVIGAAAATVDGTAFVLGGSGGSADLDSVLAWQPGRAVHRTAHLPAPVRFAAAASAGGAVILAGGMSGGVPSRSILRFVPATHRVTRIGLLPVALSHAGAATLAGLVFVIGGRGGAPGSVTRAIYAIDPVSGAARFAGVLPTGLADAAVAAVGDMILVAGGIDRTGRVQRAVLRLTLP